jgi:hypothetical protein
MQSQNPTTQKSESILCRDSEKFNSNKKVLTKLLLAIHFISQNTITSEPWLKLKKTYGIVPWPIGNPALELQVARTVGTPSKLQKKTREKFKTRSRLLLLVILAYFYDIFILYIHNNRPQ